MPRENDKLQDLDDIFVLNGRVRINQPAGEGLRTSVDSVFLGAACPARPGETVLDLGCGVGAAGFCVRARVPGVQLTGVDIQPDLIALAQQNAQAGLEKTGTAVFVCADALAPEFQLDGAPFDQIVCNPPYLEAGTYVPSPDEVRARALGHAAGEYKLEDWLRAAHRLLRSRGTLTMIHRADYLDQILVGLGRRFGAVEVIPLWPRAGQAARRVIVRAIKDRRGGLTLHPGLVVHDGAGWSDSAVRILKDAEGLFLS